MSTEHEALSDWLAAYLGNYTLPANYAASLFGQTHREVAKYAAPTIAEDLLDSAWLRDHDAALTAKAKAEAWDEGYNAGSDDEVNAYWGKGPVSINPYREPR